MSTRSKRFIFLRQLRLSFCLLISSTFALAQPYETSDVLPSNVYLSSVTFEQQKMHYAFSGNPDAPGVLFIHGTPGSWQAFSGYLGSSDLQRDYFLVSVDRLGWGLSKINKEGSELDKDSKAKQPEPYEFSVQSAAIAAVMRRYPDKKWLLVGHSLGASIAPKVALLESNNVTGLLLLAGSHKPSLGSARWYNLAASLMLVRWMLPENLRYSNDEIMALKKELRLLEQELSETSLETEVVVIQGMQDRLVSPKNASYAELRWGSTFSKLKTIELPEVGHFIPWKHAALVRETIRQFDF